MIDKSVPNNRRPLILIIKMIGMVILAFLIVAIYGEYRDEISIEWLAEFFLIFSLVLILWFYRVSNGWHFEENGYVWDIIIHFNFFLVGTMVVSLNGYRKVYPCTFSKDSEILFSKGSKSYAIKITRDRGNNYFHCSVDEIKR